MAITSKYKKYASTGAVVLVAVAAVLFKYGDYVTNPWTRDGRVRADVIQIASRVTAPIVEVSIEDNQFVRAGDILFRLDPRTFETALAKAKAELDLTLSGTQASVAEAMANVRAAKAELNRDKAEYERQQTMQSKNAASQKSVESAGASYEMSREQLKSAEAALESARAAGRRADDSPLAETQGEAGSRLRLAEAQLSQAELNLEFATITAPVDGYVTNVNLRVGDHVVADRPVLALVDVNSYWVHGFFKETSIADIKPGDRAVVTLMSYPDIPLEGRVESLGWGIAQSDGAPSTDLLPSVAPTFEWIRLAQRIPVRVRLIDVPDGVDLRVGSTCSVLVRTGETNAEPEALPGALQ
jgi:multidrug resistance efflux pump